MSEYCFSQVLKASGDDFDEAAFKDLTERIDNIRKSGKSPEEVDAFVRDLLESERIAAGEARNALLLNTQKRLELNDYIYDQFNDSTHNGLESAMVSTNVARIGNKLSAEAHQAALKDEYLGGLFADLEQGGYDTLLASGEFDLAIRQEWRNLDNNNGKVVSGIKEALEIAKIFQKHYDKSTLHANQAGAFINKLMNRTTRHAYDALKIERVGRAKFIELAMEALDHDHTFQGLADSKKGEFLSHVYDTLTIGKLQEASFDISEGAKKFFPKLARTGIARKWGAQRILHFKSAEAEHFFMQQFGRGNLREEVFAELMGKARTTGLAKVLGTVPEETVDLVVKDISARLRKEGRTADAKKLELEWNNGNGRLGNILKEIDGRAAHPVNEQLARYAANYRSVKRMATLGAATVSSTPDLAVAVSELTYQGNSALSAYADIMAGMAKGRGPKELRQLHADIGAFSSSMLGDINRRFSGDDSVSGRLSRLEQKFFKYNGLNWWTESLRTAAVDVMSTRLASMRGTAWVDVDKKLKRVLQGYSIDEGKWDIIRAAKTVDHEGVSYASPANIKDLPDSHFEEYLKKNDGSYAGLSQKAKVVSLEKFRREVEDSLRLYFVDSAQRAVLETGARTRATLRQGTQAGTVLGEGMRLVTLYKGYPTAFIQKVLGREIYGYDANIGQLDRSPFVMAAKAMVNVSGGQAGGILSLMLGTTILGYMAGAAKDVLKGRVPRDPKDPRTIMAALLQGGGLGIYGDFLFGQVLKENRFGGSVAATLAGPFVSDFDNATKLASMAVNRKDASANAIRFGLGFVPFGNFPVVRAAADYTFLYGIQESLNPGYLRRMERNLQRENGQEFLYPPSRNAIR